MSQQIRRGEMYYADLSPVVGSEQGGFRPVLILQNNKGNQHSSTVIVSAITSKSKKTSLPTHYQIPVGSGLEINSIVLLEQIRTIDKSRISQYIGLLDETTMRGVDRAIWVSMGLAENEGHEQ